MADVLINADLIIRKDTAANWTANNPILKPGQEGFETDTRKSKVGTGAHWNDTDYRYGGSSLKELNLTQADIGTSYGGALTYDSGASILSLNWTSEVQAVLGTSIPKVFNLWLSDGTNIYEFRPAYLTKAGSNISALTWYGVASAASFDLQVAST